jgi:hypothetical protein
MQHRNRIELAQNALRNERPQSFVKMASDAVPWLPSAIINPSSMSFILRLLDLFTSGSLLASILTVCLIQPTGQALANDALGHDLGALVIANAECDALVMAKINPCHDEDASQSNAGNWLFTDK